MPQAQAIIENAASFRGRDLLSLSYVRPRALLELFATAARVKADASGFRRVLDGKAFAMLFEKASLRTKMSFEVGIARLGGQPIFMDHAAARLGVRESVPDYARNLERWVDCIIARVYRQSVIGELADVARCPVINALCDMHHPCQGLADLFTLYERARHDADALRSLKLAYVGDGNNVCHSLMHAATLLGVNMTVLGPEGFGPDPSIVKECEAFAKDAGSTLTITSDASKIAGHHAVYTDVWMSMGHGGGESEASRRREVFAPYQVNAKLMARASEGLSQSSWFMHCLPAQRGIEVTDDVIDAPSSIVYDQAENRMHAQNALLIHIFAR